MKIKTFLLLYTLTNSLPTNAMRFPAVSKIRERSIQSNNNNSCQIEQIDTKFNKYQIHGQEIIDNYAWMVDPNWTAEITKPDVLDYIAKENNRANIFLINTKRFITYWLVN
jgi:hypothetical protein